MIHQDIAIVIFAFNRPDKLSRLVESLLPCPEFAKCPLYIFIDGPRNEEEANAVRATASLAESIGHPSQAVYRREHNFGLQRSLRDGIGMILERHEAVIVLEDDLVLGPYALDFMIAGLGKYCEDKRVASICAYAIGEDCVDEHDDAKSLFLPMTYPWGWATWRDRWQVHLRSLGTTQNGKLLESASFRQAINVFGLRNFLQMLKLADQGIINSWWIYWHKEAVLRNQVSLFPAQTHVINVGIDGTGTHASRWNFLRGRLPQKRLSKAKTTLPAVVETDFLALDKIMLSREARNHRIIGALGFIRRKLKGYLG